MAANAHRCTNARPPYAHDFMVYDIGDGDHKPFLAMMACRKCGEVRSAEAAATPPVALDDVLASMLPAKTTTRARATRPKRRGRA